MDHGSQMKRVPRSAWWASLALASMSAIQALAWA